MSVPDSIIVYRNPAEAALWEAASNGMFFPVIAAASVFLLIFVGVAELRVMKRVFGKHKDNVSLVIAAMAAVFTAWYLWI